LLCKAEDCGKVTKLFGSFVFLWKKCHLGKNGETQVPVLAFLTILHGTTPSRKEPDAWEKGNINRRQAECWGRLKVARPEV
jgi:hypothetical protein